MIHVVKRRLKFHHMEEKEEEKEKKEKEEENFLVRSRKRYMYSLSSPTASYH